MWVKTSSKAGWNPSMGQAGEEAADQALAAGEAAAERIDEEQGHPTFVKVGS